MTNFDSRIAKNIRNGPKFLLTSRKKFIQIVGKENALRRLDKAKVKFKTDFLLLWPLRVKFLPLLPPKLQLSGAFRLSNFLLMRIVNCLISIIFFYLPKNAKEFFFLLFQVQIRLLLQFNRNPRYKKPPSIYLPGSCQSLSAKMYITDILNMAA